MGIYTLLFIDSDSEDFRGEHLIPPYEHGKTNCYSKRLKTKIQALIETYQLGRAHVGTITSTRQTGRSPTKV